MYVIREVLHCKPGKVRQMVEKFRGISTVLKEMGQEPLRLPRDSSCISPTPEVVDGKGGGRESQGAREVTHDFFQPKK